ncbi:tryptophan synthase beta subunit-like PLP-dependent enzyme [Colletotrichum phormii]|uniref:Tryptophan synthase beta subunit-like PLP-dependent enzyme n=1 Tax=Colletotrichum phormii TaxID=359342 RepID=A0AAJ0E9N9_9PEZI|nr:tryptophan synthase beta subunit-like PLP-dependent enzyme [Colletotrichum phormii]KAK1623025.1 tryptophan synthase beta subunit-like PLP-dependent enzyme [Colletotrichum phormii]
MTPNFHEVAASAVQARSRIKSHIYTTPLLPARVAGHDNNATVLFKAENFQLTGSFKLRGATSKISASQSQYTSDSSSSTTTTTTTTTKKLITASSGNHGIGAAHAAHALNCALTVVLPETVFPAKLAKIKSYGATVILHGAETGLAEQHAQQLAASGEYTYISPYNDPLVVAGQGTIALEILEQCAAQGIPQLDNIFISMGGGGLISGIGSVLKSFAPNVRIFGVAATNSQALAESILAGKVVETEHLPTLAEAVAGGMDEDSITLPLAREVVDRVVECSEEEIADAMRRIAVEENMIVEGAAALALAGFEKVKGEVGGQTSVVLLCGGMLIRGL